MLRVIGELPNMEFLGPLPVRHDVVRFAHAGNAPEQQQVIGHAPRVCPLHIEAAAGIRCIPVAHGAFQDDKRAGAVRLPDILAQRLQHSVLYRFGRLHIPVQILKGDALLLQRVLQQRGHILGKKDAHNGDIVPQGFHIVLKDLHLKIQRLFDLGLGTAQPAKQGESRIKRRDQQHRQHDHVADELMPHGAPRVFQIRQYLHGLYLP